MNRLHSSPAVPAGLALILSFAAGGSLGAQTPVASSARGCTPARDGLPAAAWLERATQATGMHGVRGRVVRYRGVDGVEQNYQSDRTYPPFFSAFTSRDVWFDPASGVERFTSRTMDVGQEITGPALLNVPSATYLVRDSQLSPAPQLHRAALLARPLDAWAVLHDFSAATDVMVEGRCVYRDYPRVVLRRQGAFGPERLFLDVKTALPVKLDRTEPHYLWGQQHVEYVYSTWLVDDGVAHPGSAFRLADGDVEVSRTVSRFSLVAADSASSLAIPAGAAPMPLPLPGFLRALPTDTARVGPSAFLLGNLGYAEAVALARDTVFLFDATQSEDRARQDSSWIGRLYPGRHPIVLIVTDLAWPHVAGLRFWVASGATVVSHRASREFLSRIVARRWTLTPDKLERARPRAPLVFRAVSDSLPLAGGDVGVYAIDGIGSEGALMAYVRDGRFLWGSDYVQDVTQPTLYALEVWRAAARAKLDPLTVAAEHLHATPWATLLRVNQGMEVEGR
jgi:hypothetical protein